MPPKRGAATPKRESARLSRNGVKSTPKATNQKKSLKTSLVKSPAKCKETPSKPVVSKATPSNKVCPDCKESFSSTVLFKRHQSTCGSQEKVKESRKRPNDVEEDIDVISAKIKKNQEDIENDVEIIAGKTKKDDKDVLQAFMSNKVQSLMSVPVAPEKNIDINKSKETSLSSLNSGNNVSISALSLKKNIALSMQKNDIAESSKPRRGRKPVERNPNTSTAAQNSVAASPIVSTPESNKTSLRESVNTSETSNVNTCNNVTAISLISAEKGEKLTFANDTSKSNNELITKSKDYSPQEQPTKENAHENVKTPARRGRPPKKTLEEKKKEAANDANKISSSIHLTGTNNTIKDKDTMSSEQEHAVSLNSAEKSEELPFANGASKSNNELSAKSKDYLLQEQPTKENAHENIKTPARRGRPPKKTLEEKKKEAADEASKMNSSVRLANKNTIIKDKDTTMIPQQECEKEEVENVAQSTNPSIRRGRSHQSQTVNEHSSSPNLENVENLVANDLNKADTAQIDVEKEKLLALCDAEIQIISTELASNVVVKEEEDDQNLTPKKKKKPKSKTSETSISESDKDKNIDQVNKDSDATTNNAPAEAVVKVFSCAVCQKKFTRKYHLDRHLKISRCSGLPLPSFPCELCNRVYTRKDNLREHLRSHAGEVHRRKKHKCQYCDKAFHGQSLLAIHVRKHTGEKPFACDFCPKKFPSAGALSKHRMTHTGERPYSCNECGRRFRLRSTLHRHKRTHSGLKPYPCPHCEKKFTQIGLLNSHVFYHTGDNGFNCDECGKSFSRKSRLEIHKMYVHSDVKPFTCEKCPKTFTRKLDVMRHSLLHTGVKPYRCSICNRYFRVKATLKLHLLTHKREQPRACPMPMCNRAFSRKDCYLRHMKKRHKEEFDKMSLEEKNPDDLVVDDPPKVLSEKDLTKNITELLSLLVDEKTLTKYGWPNKPVVEILDRVIRRCGHSPAKRDNCDGKNRLRENAKLLFTVVIDDDYVTSLLESQTVDQVILHVINLAKT